MKTLKNLAVPFVLAVATMTVAVAQPKSVARPTRTTVVKKLPQGKTKEQLNDRLSAILARRRSEMQKQREEEERQIRAIVDATSSERTKMMAALNADPNYKKFTDEMKRISSGKGTSQQKAEQMNALARRNQGMLTGAMKKAGIDRNALQSKLQKVAPGTIVTSDFSVRRTVSKKRAQVSSLPSTPTTQEVTLRPPFTYEESESDNQGIAYSDATATPDADRGRANASVIVVGLAGAGSSTAEFGEFVTVPAGVKRMEVTVKLKNDFSGNALGAIGTSISQASVSVSIDNTGSTASGQYDDEYKSDIAMAPIAWYAEMEGSQAGEYRFTFDVPNNSREYLVSGRAFAYSIGAGVPGYASAQAKAEIDRITLKYHYE